MKDLEASVERTIQKKKKKERGLGKFPSDIFNFLNRSRAPEWQYYST